MLDEVIMLSPTGAYYTGVAMVFEKEVADHMNRANLL